VALLALLLLLIFGIWSGGTDVVTEDQVCTAAEEGPERCGPTAVDGTYDLPASGTVVHALVNNGSLPPEYQQGYEITIDTTGQATVVVTPEGASPELGDLRTAEQITTTVDLGTDGLQQLLRDLDNQSFFLLPTREEVERDGVIAGDSVSIVEVTLAEGTWEISGSGMEPGDRARLDAFQDILAITVGLNPANPTGTSM
jgi:hypothetical protein